MSFVILFPLVGGIVLLFSEFKESVIKGLSLQVSVQTFQGSLVLWVGFDASSGEYQYLTNGYICDFGIDGISQFLIQQTGQQIPICQQSSWNVTKNVKEYFASFLQMEGLLMMVFSAQDIQVFYICFESIQIPMFLQIGVWGSRERKVRASYQFFQYTLFGSVFMQQALQQIYLETGTTNYQQIQDSGLSMEREYLYWQGFFVSFGVKVPMLPQHLWQPEAHVEAPTAGSVQQAGILQKQGSYGQIRYSLPLFPTGTVYFTPLVYTICLQGVVYTSQSAIRQSDIKRIIAYASVAHMNQTLIGLFSQTSQGVEGSQQQMQSHGLVSGGQFQCVGVVYDRYHTRQVKYYSGLVHTMPLYAQIFQVFTMGNIAQPGTSSFVGEFQILVGIYQTNTFVCILGGTSMVLGGCYSLWLYNRVIYGNLKREYSVDYSDVSRREFESMLPLQVLTLQMGIYPDVFQNEMHFSCENQIRIYD